MNDQAIIERLDRLEQMLSRLLGQSVEPSAPVEQQFYVPAEGENPYLMDERALKMAERLMSAEDAEILRLRVYAARAEHRGGHAAAHHFRNKANRKEKRLENSRKAA